MPKIFDRVAVESWQRDEVIQKFPREGLGDIKLGSQLIVNPGETAVFVRGGEAMGTFTPGRHTLTTENIPMPVSYTHLDVYKRQVVYARP